MSSDLPLAGKTGVIFGVANKRSIAWAIAQAWHKAGAKLIFNYQGERPKGKRRGTCRDVRRGDADLSLRCFVGRADRRLF